MKKNLKYVLLSILLSPTFLVANDTSLKEIGVSLGTPSALNLSLGFWGAETLPALVRVSGMYFGDTLQGVQGELGWVFDSEGPFRQYVSAALMTMHIENQRDKEILHFTGLGPVYGFNLGGFALLGGILFGEGTKTGGGNAPQNIPASLVLQLGYGALF